MRNLKGRIEAAEAKLTPSAWSGVLVLFDDEPTPANLEGRQVLRVRFVDPLEVRHAS